MKYFICVGEVFEFPCHQNNHLLGIFSSLNEAEEEKLTKLPRTQCSYFTARIKSNTVQKSATRPNKKTGLGHYK